MSDTNKLLFIYSNIFFYRIHCSACKRFLRWPFLFPRSGVQGERRWHGSVRLWTVLFARWPLQWASVCIGRQHLQLRVSDETVRLPIPKRNGRLQRWTLWEKWVVIVSCYFYLYDYGWFKKIFMKWLNVSLNSVHFLVIFHYCYNLFHCIEIFM